MVERDFGIVLPAAGSGTRFGGGDKLLMDLAGRSVLQRSVGLFASRADVSTIVIVTAPDRFEAYRQHLEPVISDPQRLAFAGGGRERWESVLFGLRHLVSPADAPLFVAVHDAARPLTPHAVVDAAFATTRTSDAALPCVAEPCTLKRAGADSAVAETVDRRGLFQAQTPQCFRLRKLLAGYEKLLHAGKIADVTDDAQIFERMQFPVPITAGDPLNLKITTTGDVALARAIIASQSQ